MLLGDSGDIARFPTRHHYASYTGTAPIELSSGGRIVHRLSRRGNRQLNHALHIAAVTQIRHAHSEGRVFYDRKREGKTRRRPRLTRAREGKPGTTLTPAWPALHPDHRLFGSATPEPTHNATTPDPTLPGPVSSTRPPRPNQAP